MESVEWYNRPRKMRLLFKVKESYYRFYWFEYKDDNLYWGSSSKKHYSSIGNVEKLKVEPNTNSAIITVNQQAYLDEIKASKYSYHMSGIFHGKEKTDQEENTIVRAQLPKPADILSPFLLFSLISKPLKGYEFYESSLTKSQTFAMVLNCPESFLNCRLTFEFFLSPIGNFAMPNFLLNHLSNINMQTFSLNENLVLAFRHAVNNDSKFNNWHIDKEILFLPGAL